MKSDVSYLKSRSRNAQQSILKWHSVQIGSVCTIHSKVDVLHQETMSMIRPLFPRPTFTARQEGIRALEVAWTLLTTCASLYFQMLSFYRAPNPLLSPSAWTILRTIVGPSLRMARLNASSRPCANSAGFSLKYRRLAIRALRLIVSLYGLVYK